jgi:hypothetical protein
MDHHLLMSPWELNVMTYANAGLSLLIIVMGVWYAFYGRKIDRGMMWVNIIGGVWVMVAYVAIFIDALWVDFISPAEITCYVIRPAIFVLLCVMLSNIIRIGRRDGHGDGHVK